MRTYSDRQIDQRFEVLAAYERRCVVSLLLEAENGHISIGDLVSHLQKEDSTADERDEIVLTLLHTHLPKLASIDILEYDPRSEVVRYHGDELVESLIDVTNETRAPCT